MNVLLGLALFILSINLASGACTPQYSCPDWGTCLEGIQTRTCEDIACNGEPIVERQLCMTDNAQCNVKYSCSSWSSCTYFDKTNDILANNIRFTGYQERTCVDVNNCVEDFIDQTSCEDTFKVKFVKLEQCGTEFLVALDANSQREVSQINLDSWRSKQLDISFIQSNFSYCPSCYNGVKDVDEEEVDCGGSCKECTDETGISKQIIVAGSSWFISILVLLGFIFSTFLDKKAKIRRLIYKAYKDIDRKDKEALKRHIYELKSAYRRLDDSQKDIFRKELDRLYRRV